MATMATTVMLSSKCFSISSPPSHPSPPKPAAMKPISLPKGLTISNPADISIRSPAIAGAIFSALSCSDAAFAAQQIADIAEGGDSRGLALLLPIVPALAWVLFNILQPALNQVNRMTSERGFVVGIGLGGGLAAAGLMSAPEAAAVAAGEMGMIADSSASSDSRGLLLLFVVAPAILWVLYNILQPALNQINKMRS